jgi:ribosomal protein L21E
MTQRVAESFMKSDFSVGDRVKLSVLGERRCPRLAGKTGTVVGRSIYVNSVAVLFDGNKSPRTIHGAYLGPIQEHADLADNSRVQSLAAFPR